MIAMWGGCGVSRKVFFSAFAPDTRRKQKQKGTKGREKGKKAHSPGFHRGRFVMCGTFPTPPPSVWLLFFLDFGLLFINRQPFFFFNFWELTD